MIMIMIMNFGRWAAGFMLFIRQLLSTAKHLNRVDLSKCLWAVESNFRMVRHTICIIFDKGESIAKLSSLVINLNHILVMELPSIDYEIFLRNLIRNHIKIIWTHDQLITRHKVEYDTLQLRNPSLWVELVKVNLELSS